MSNMLNKDFYSFLPGFIRSDLDEKIEKYSNEPWFEEVWESYRKHVKENDRKHMQTPNYFFKTYLDSKPEEKIFEPVEEKISYQENKEEFDNISNEELEDIFTTNHDLEITPNEEEEKYEEITETES